MWDHNTILFLPVPVEIVKAHKWQGTRQLQTEWASDPAPSAFAPTATNTAMAATAPFAFAPTTTTTAMAATVLLRLLLVSLLLV